MKKSVKKTKKKMTIEDLAVSMQKGFKSLENKLVTRMDEKIDNLAVMTAKGFDSVDKRFEAIDKRFESVENRLENVELGQKKIFQEILNIHDTFVKRSEFDNLANRLSRVEQKLKLKSK